MFKVKQKNRPKCVLGRRKPYIDLCPEHNIIKHSVLHGISPTLVRKSKDSFFKEKKILFPTMK